MNYRDYLIEIGALKPAPEAVEPDYHFSASSDVKRAAPKQQARDTELQQRRERGRKR
jgi:hypothetical protein